MIGSKNLGQNFSKNNSIVVPACQSFQFFRQNVWFLENNRVLFKFLNGISHYLQAAMYHRYRNVKSGICIKLLNN